jgi:hypothetical protein
MVLMSSGKAARNQNKIVNRTNTCGGNKKAGLGRGIGSSGSSFTLTAMRRTTNSIPKKCEGSYLGKKVVSSHSSMY